MRHFLAKLRRFFAEMQCRHRLIATKADALAWMERHSARLQCYLEGEKSHYRDFRACSKPGRFLGAFHRLDHAFLDVEIADRFHGSEYFLRPANEDSLDNSLWRRDPEMIVVNADFFSSEMENLLVNDDESLIGFTIADGADGERKTGRIGRPADGYLFPDRLCNVTSWAWLNPTTLIYAVADEKFRPNRVRIWKIDGSDKCVFDEDDERFLVNVNRTKDGKLIVITSASKASTECWLMDDAAVMKCIQRRQFGLDYFLEHLDGYLYMITNLGAPDYQLRRIAIADLDSAQWQDFYRPAPGTIIKNADFFHDRIVLYIRRNG
jgi:protease II